MIAQLRTPGPGSPTPGAATSGPTTSGPATSQRPTGSRQPRPMQSVPQPAARRIVTLADRPELAAAVPAVLSSRWPAFLLAGRPGHRVELDALLLANAHHQVLLVDGDEVLGVALSVPLDWDRTVAGLPAGRDGAVTAAAHLLAHGGTATTVCALSVTLTPAAAGRDLAASMIAGVKAAAAEAGATALISPVRPVLKSRYPLTPMSRYLDWRTTQDEAFDPWLRLHLQLGGLPVAVAHRSTTINGSISEWEQWTGLALPASGEYVIPDGLVPLVVDRAAGTAEYREPHAWVVHRTDA